MYSISLEQLEKHPRQLWEEIITCIGQEPYYLLINNYYQGKIAKRSQLPYINHINEGIYVLCRIFGWSEVLIAAYCLHPMCQSNNALLKACNYHFNFSGIDPVAIFHAMEYRRIANNYISTMAVRLPQDIELSPVDGVNKMLVADKIQNKKDFMLYMYNKFERKSYKKASEKYLNYFNIWLKRLGVSTEVYETLAQELESIEYTKKNVI